MLSMASSPKSADPLLVSVKAVDPAVYPYYGAVEFAPAMTMRGAVGDQSVAVGEDLLLRLGLHVGDQLKLGGKVFRISGSVVDEPDWLSGNFDAGPRVFISRGELG